MKLDQCVFGYDDGHKLLASSLPLGSEASFLTELSDLAPGTVFGQAEGYWTGVPAPAIGRYVLMRTWPAPEMPRPGCVWTHALLIEPSLLESLEHLSALQGIVNRPSSNMDIARYRNPLLIENFVTAPLEGPLNEKIVKKLIYALYGKGSSAVSIASPGDLDNPLFSIWSQQWPRLRRNLRFQTAAIRSHSSSNTVRFDVTAALGDQSETITEKDGLAAAWITSAALDVEDDKNGTLRRFLWRYGQDVKRQRNSFKPLVELSLMDSESENMAGENVLALVAKAFPSLKDAHLLKQELVDGVLISSAQPEAVKFFLLHKDNPVLPPPTLAGIDKLEGLWSSKLDELLKLADITAYSIEPLERILFSAITSHATASKFWSLTNGYPLLRNRMLEEKPELLFEAGALVLEDELLAEKLPLIPLNSRELPEFIFKLLSRDNSILVSTTFECFPSVAAKQVIRAENETPDGISKIWRDALLRHPKLLLTTEVIGSASRTSVLFRYLEALGWSTPSVIAAGSTPWVAALQSAYGDLWGEQEDLLNSFVLMLALMSGDDGKRGVELLFDSVHAKILRDGLHGRAREMLSAWLPELGWFSNWDIGLRLRLFVADMYVQNGWPIQSFAGLSKDSKARTMLADAASEVPGGKPFSKSISK